MRRKEISTHWNGECYIYIYATEKQKTKITPTVV